MISIRQTEHTELVSIGDKNIFGATIRSAIVDSGGNNFDKG